MPLRDHFRPPWSQENHWEGFHSAWANTIVRHLNGSLLPPHYRAIPQVHLGAWVEADVATFQETRPMDTPAPVAEEGTATWSPQQPAQTLVVDFPQQDQFEVRVVDEQRGQQLVAVIELVSPGNKDRPEHRRVFVAKCASYLEQQIGLVLIDVVTERTANLHRELLELLQEEPITDVSELHAVSYRVQPVGGEWHLDTWPFPLAVGQSLSAVPLWLSRDFAVRLDLDKTYEETCQVLRIR